MSELESYLEMCLDNGVTNLSWAEVLQALVLDLHETESQLNSLQERLVAIERDYYGESQLPQKIEG